MLRYPGHFTTLASLDVYPVSADMAPSLVSDWLEDSQPLERFLVLSPAKNTRRRSAAIQHTMDECLTTLQCPQDAAPSDADTMAALIHDQMVMDLDQLSHDLSMPASLVHRQFLTLFSRCWSPDVLALPFTVPSCVAIRSRMAMPA